MKAQTTLTDLLCHQGDAARVAAQVDRLVAGRMATATEQNFQGQAPQHVLKAEPVTADATDLGAPVNASPDGGPMGAGQPAAAGPAGGRA